jgi:hypothetical protein
MICRQGDGGEVAKTLHDMNTPETNARCRVSPKGFFNNLSSRAPEDLAGERAMAGVDNHKDLAGICQ